MKNFRKFIVLACVPLIFCSAHGMKKRNRKKRTLETYSTKAVSTKAVDLFREGLEELKKDNRNILEEQKKQTELLSDILSVLKLRLDILVSEKKSRVSSEFIVKPENEEKQEYIEHKKIVLDFFSKLGCEDITPEEYEEMYRRKANESFQLLLRSLDISVDKKNKKNIKDYDKTTLFRKEINTDSERSDDSDSDYYDLKVKKHVDGGEESGEDEDSDIGGLVSKKKYGDNDKKDENYSYEDDENYSYEDIDYDFLKNPKLFLGDY